MNKSVLILSIALMIPMQSIAKTANPILVCKDATKSNRKARNWLTNWQNMPANDSKYFQFINASPWCSVENGDAPNHKRIIHYSSIGIGSERWNHKLGATDWIKATWRTLKRECVVPRAFKQKKLRYVPVHGNTTHCFVAINNNQWGNKVLHQWGVKKNGKKRKIGGKIVQGFRGKKR